MTSVPQEILGPHGWTDKLTYVPAVRVGDMVYLSGMTATDVNHQLVAHGDIVGQTQRIFEKFEEVLRAAGGSCHDIVSTTEYYVTEENYAATAVVRKAFLGARRPVAAGVKVAGLVRTGALIEISAIAHIPAEAGVPEVPAKPVDLTQLYAVIRLDRPEAGVGLRQEFQDAHRRYVASLGKAVKGGGPLVADDGHTPIGGLMLIEAASRSAITAIIQQDPYQSCGLFGEPQILAWNRLRAAPQPTP